MDKKKLLIFVLVFITYGYFFHYMPDANENSRLSLVYAVVDHGTLRIDGYQDKTIDKAYYNGHYYSDKEPGTAALAVPVYIIFKFINKIFSLHAAEPIARYIIRVAVISFPSALFSVLFYQFLGYFSKNNYYRLMLAVCYSLGTIAFTYSTLFYGHQITAVILFCCFYLNFLIKKKSRENNLLIMLSGFLGGYACITEYQASVVAAMLCVYTFTVLEKKSRIWFFLWEACCRYWR